MKKLYYYLFYKPYGVLCQFTDVQGGRLTLANYGKFPKDVYPVGRLDFDSEGLVLLTNDGKLKHRLLDPSFHHPRTYLAQVEGIPSKESLNKLRTGILLGDYKTLPAEVKLLDNEPRVPQRSKPIRFRKNIPTSWIQVTLYEGKNRQVRKMTAAVGHPTLRLIRIVIGPLTINGLNPGETRSLTTEEVKKLRKSVFDYTNSRTNSTKRFTSSNEL